MREQFEKWANAKGTMGDSWDGDHYRNPLHEAAWQGWQAAVAAEREQGRKWTDDDLYDAYLRGCEDDAIPEPLDKGTFLASWDDTLDVQ